MEKDIKAENAKNEKLGKEEIKNQETIKELDMDSLNNVSGGSLGDVSFTQRAEISKDTKKKI